MLPLDNEYDVELETYLFVIGCLTEKTGALEKQYLSPRERRSVRKRLRAILHSINYSTYKLSWIMSKNFFRPMDDLLYTKIH